MGASISLAATAQAASFSATASQRPVASAAAASCAYSCISTSNEKFTLNFFNNETQLQSVSSGSTVSKHVKATAGYLVGDFCALTHGQPAPVCSHVPPSLIGITTSSATNQGQLRPDDRREGDHPDDRCQGQDFHQQESHHKEGFQLDLTTSSRKTRSEKCY
jgi:hypothetical protein